MSNDMKKLLFISILLVSGNLFSQNAKVPCCTIIDMARETGTFTIRDNHSGRIQLFKPDALEGAELKVGDTIDALFDTRKVTAIKGIAKSYDLQDAVKGDSCCVILKLDSLINESSWRITARNNITGENIQFEVPKPIAAKLNTGGVVYTQPSHGYAMISWAQSDTSATFLFGFPLLQEYSK